LNAHGYLIDGRVVEDEMPDDIVAIKDEVQDSGDIYGDLSHTERLAMCRSLLIRIREIEAHGYRTRWGRYRTDDDFDIGILIFMRATDIQHPEEFRYVVVPRRLCVQLETSWH